MLPKIRTFGTGMESRQRISPVSDPTCSKILLVVAVVGAGIAANAFATAAVPDGVAIVRSLAAQDATVLRVGERLAVAALPFCGRPGWSAGMTVQRLDQYRVDLRSVAAAELGLVNRPTITQIAGEGAAAVAGLRRGDVILAIDGADFDESKGARKGFDDVGKDHDRIEAALADGRADLKILRGSETENVTLIPRQACQVRFDLRAGRSKKEATANGTYVTVSSGVAAFAQSDGELAAVLTHELAHHILRHPHLRKARSGRPRVRDTEVQADRLSVYLMDAAGYSPSDAVAFYTRWGPKTDLGILSDGTHPGWRKRVATIESEASAIAAMKAAGQPVRAPADLQPPR